MDRENGVIKGVALLTKGQARGHSQVADQRTLEQVRDCAKQYKGGLRVRFNPGTFNHGDAGLAGRLPANTIEVAGDKTIGDLHMYKTFPYSDYLYEIAETAPDQIGLSIEFNGVPEKIGDHKFARCDEIFAATVVDLPAANPTGLFAAKGSEETNEDEENTMTNEQVAELSKQIVAGLTEGLKPVFQNAFKAKADSEIEATPDEKKAAGITDQDSKEESTRKLTEFRAKLDKPFTFRDAMNLYRFTGNGAASASPEGGKKKSDKGTKAERFEELIDEEIEGGAKNRGRAILLARKRDGKAYNAWMTKRQKDAAKQVEGEE